MDLIDFILNVAGILLWLSWRPAASQAVAAPSVSLLSTLKRPEQHEPKRWVFLAMLFALIFGRTFLYHHLGGDAEWTPQINLVAIALPCRSAFLGRMFLYSFFSFATALAAVYTWLLLLAVVNRRLPENDPLQRLVRLHLGWVSRLPWLAKAWLPFSLAVVLWFPLSAVFAKLGLMPYPQSMVHTVEQGIVIGLGWFLVLKHLLLAILLLHLLNSYVYLGNHPFWGYVNQTARNLLWPLGWVPLRLGKFDFLPLAVIGALAVGERLASAWLAEWFKHLPF